MHSAEFEQRKKDMWAAFDVKRYEDSAKMAAELLQDSFGLDAIHVAGLSLSELGRHEEGFDWLCASLSLANGSANWYVNAAKAMFDAKDYVHAMLFVENGVREYPEHVQLQYMRGLCMCYTACWSSAIEFFDKTLELDPKFYHAVMSKGYAVHMLGRHEEAIELYKSIYDVAAPDDHEQIVNNHVCVMMEQGKQKEAYELLEREYGHSTRSGTLYNKSFLLLGMGDWPRAWHMYRTRATAEISGQSGMPAVDSPTIQTLDEAKNKKLFLFHEQGLGDTLMFIRYAQQLEPIALELIIGVPKPLRRLTETLILKEPFTVVSDQEIDKPIFTAVDVAVPMLDCPALFDTTMDTIPAPIPYFKIPDEIVNQHLLPETSKPRVGLVWAGASRIENVRAHSIDTRRSIAFAQLDPILQLHDSFQFVSLQLSDHRVDDSRLLQPINDDFDVLDTAGIIEQLDLLITIDSAMCHLGGALGKPVWMLSRWDGCWRWHWPEDESSPLFSRTPWYPSFSIYRQKAHHTWPEVIERVVKDLQLFR